MTVMGYDRGGLFAFFIALSNHCDDIVSDERNCQ